MQSIHSVDTVPEKSLRHKLHSLGYRYRLHCKYLPGKPDIVFPARRKVIFVNGCFWHRHHCKRGKSTPATNRPFWLEKFEGNKKRDKRNRRDLRKLGWSVFTVWECQINKKPDWVMERVIDFLES